MNDIQRPKQAGFTIVEIIVVILIMGIALSSMAVFFSTLESTQRRSRYLDSATNAAKDQIEVLRNSNYALLAVPSTLSFTSSLPPDLPSGATGTVQLSDPALTGLKRADVTINYSIGSQPQTVTLSALIGASGVSP